MGGSSGIAGARIPVSSNSSQMMCVPSSHTTLHPGFLSFLHRHTRGSLKMASEHIYSSTNALCDTVQVSSEASPKLPPTWDFDSKAAAVANTLKRSYPCGSHDILSRTSSLRLKSVIPSVFDNLLARRRLPAKALRTTQRESLVSRSVDSGDITKGSAAYSLSTCCSTEYEESSTIEFSTPPSPSQCKLTGVLKVEKIKSLTKTSRCQFTVWEVEVVENTLSVFDDNDNEVSDVHDRSCRLWWPVPIGFRFALKLMTTERSTKKQTYRSLALLNEGRNLQAICKNYMPHDSSVQMSSQTAPGRPNIPWKVQNCPVPQYYWTLNGDMYTTLRDESSGLCDCDHTSEGVLCVAMELIQGTPLTAILRDMTSEHLKSPQYSILLLEISLAIVRAQKAIAHNAACPLINWDTKPSNIMVELETKQDAIEASHVLHFQAPYLKRVLIIDLGDALLGEKYFFPTYSPRLHEKGCKTEKPSSAPVPPDPHQKAGHDHDGVAVGAITKNDETNRHVICTTGFCAPECSILVFLLSCIVHQKEFRKLWYRETVDLKRLHHLRRLRLGFHWKQWFQEGWLVHTDALVHSYDVCFSDATVVFSTGLILCQLLGGRSIVTVAKRDIVRALDGMCEWRNDEEKIPEPAAVPHPIKQQFFRRTLCGAQPAPETEPPAPGIHDVLPTQGFLVETETLKNQMYDVLRGCLRFVPGERFTFEQVETALSHLIADARRLKYSSSS